MASRSRTRSSRSPLSGTREPAMPIRTGSRPAVSSLVGLVILVTIVQVTQPSRPIRASQEEPVLTESPQDGPRPSPLVDDEEQALAEFLDTYRLAPGQDLKRIPPPRPEEGIRVWSGRMRPRQPGLEVGDLPRLRAMLLDWRDPDQLGVRATMSGGHEGWTIREIPRLLGMVRNSYEIEGDPELLEMEIGGDWIFRMGVPAERLVRPLEAILQRATRRRMRLALRRVERAVVVARGRYRPSPLPGHADAEIEVYARELAREDGRGGGQGGFPYFLEWLGEWIGRPVLNEVESPPQGPIRWHSNQREPASEQTRREDRDETRVLKHLEEQTGLTFARQNRPITILFVERATSPK